MIIVIGSNKGGCGKSTTITNLAIAFAKKNLVKLTTTGTAKKMN